VTTLRTSTQYGSGCLHGHGCLLATELVLSWPSCELASAIAARMHSADDSRSSTRAVLWSRLQSWRATVEIRSIALAYPAAVATFKSSTAMVMLCDSTVCPLPGAEATAAAAEYRDRRVNAAQSPGLFNVMIGLPYLRVAGNVALIAETLSSPAILQIGCEKSSGRLGVATIP
jgi:hypothetical protein